MIAGTPLAWTWQPRALPLAPCAVFARGEAAAALVRLAIARRLVLSAVVGADLVVCTDDGATLPWVDGVVYLGRDQRAPDLYLPTTLAPDVPLDLFARAIVGRARAALAGPGTPLAVVGNIIVSLAALRPWDLARLETWRAA